jgi:hypothetical protein
LILFFFTRIFFYFPTLFTKENSFVSLILILSFSLIVFINNMLTTWTDSQLRVLINQRKTENDYFHELSCNMKHNYWKGVASKINLEFGTTYTGRQCKEKFQSLVRAYKVYKHYFTFNYFSILNSTNIILLENAIICRW